MIRPKEYILEDILASSKDLTSSGNITIINSVPAGAGTPGSFVAIALDDGAAALNVQVTGTYTGALSLQVTIDGTNWVTVGGNVFWNAATGALAATIASAAVGIFQADCAGFTAARITALAAVTGTAVVTVRASKSTSIVALDSSIPAGSAAIGSVDTELPAAAALADAAANATTPTIGGASMLFNGVTWDRARGNANNNTGDTGAKVATGNGATQTNYNARGAIITLVLGAVTGTTPTCVLKVQGSGDSGTTWFDLPGAATASLTAANASSNVVLTVFPGVTVAANAAVSYPLPRTWRVVWTIGGTTPSFAITAIQVAYLTA